MNWFKFYGQEYLTDPKMMNLDPTERALWLTLLCLASQDNGVIKYADSEKIMILTGIMPNDNAFTKYYDFLIRFEKLSLITDDNETIVITNYNKRQNTNLSGYERVKRSREKSKSKAKIDNKSNVINDNARIDKNRIDKNIVKKENIKKEKTLTSINQDDFQQIAEKYNVPIAFVISKFDDLSNWHEKDPRKNHYANYYRALMDWVKRDALKIAERGAQNVSKRGIDARNIQ